MLKFIWKFIKGLMLLVVILAISVVLLLQLAPVFGGSPDTQSMTKIEASNHFDGEIFKNLIPTIIRTPSDTEMSVMDLLSPPAGKNPNQPLPSQSFNKNDFNNGDFVWFGHSTVLMRLENTTIITDPVFYSAAPFSFMVKPFEMKIDNGISDLPDIDVVLISHDHYDHLDYRSIREMDHKVKKYLVPLGIKAHLQRWGVADQKIVEMDWHDNESVKAVRFTLTPARHFSGRGLTNRNSTLWGSWVVQSKSSSVYFSGDSGYFDGFKEIGDEFGPFDIAFMEDGAYNKAWSQIHMFPEESVQASIDLNAKVYVPIHWGKYDLAVHSWTDPITRAKKKARQIKVQIATPLIGEVFTTKAFPQNDWWESVR